MKNPPKMPKMPASKELDNIEYLLFLLESRELKLFKSLGEKMAAAGRDGTFTTWMLHESDLIQMAARSFGDNLIAKRYKRASINYVYKHGERGDQPNVNYTTLPTLHKFMYLVNFSTKGGVSKMPKIWMAPIYFLSHFYYLLAL